MIALHENVPNCQNTLTVLTQRWRIFHQYIWMDQMCMTGAGTTQDNFILPAPPVGGLAWQNEACWWKSGKDILADYMFKISVGYTNLGTRQIQGRLGSWICLFIALNASMAWVPNKKQCLFWQYLKRHTFVSPSQSGDVPASYDVKLGDSERGNPLPSHGLLFPNSSTFSCIYASPHRQDNTYHGLC